jgi:hypothetical protein
MATPASCYPAMSAEDAKFSPVVLLTRCHSNNRISLFASSYEQSFHPFVRDIRVISQTGDGSHRISIQFRYNFCQRNLTDAEDDPRSVHRRMETVLATTTQSLREGSFLRKPTLNSMTKADISSLMSCVFRTNQPASLSLIPSPTALWADSFIL